MTKKLETIEAFNSLIVTIFAFLIYTLSDVNFVYINSQFNNNFSNFYIPIFVSCFWSFLLSAFYGCFKIFRGKQSELTHTFLFLSSYLSLNYFVKVYTLSRKYILIFSFVLLIIFLLLDKTTLKFNKNYQYLFTLVLIFLGSYFLLMPDIVVSQDQDIVSLEDESLSDYEKIIYNFENFNSSNSKTFTIENKYKLTKNYICCDEYSYFDFGQKVLVVLKLSMKHLYIYRAH